MVLLSRSARIFLPIFRSEVPMSKRLVVLLVALAASACGASSGAVDAAEATGGIEAVEAADDGAPDAASLPGPLRIVTFNVLCSLCDPAFDKWSMRLEYFRDLFARHDPDLIGLQELIFPAEVDQMVALLPHPYAAIYWPGNDDLNAYPDATVLYRTDRFELLDHGFFWLSPTPDVPGSKGFAASQLIRLVTWTRLKRLADGRELTFATTHFDNNQPSQPLSAPVLLERAEPWAAAGPTVVVGDFNSKPDSPAYQTLVGGVDGQGFHFENAYDLAAGRDLDANLAPPPPWAPENRIDHVFLAGAAWTCPRWVVDLHKYGEDVLFPSDHRAILAECSF